MDPEHIAQSLIDINPKLDKGLLVRTLAFVINAHKGQLRKSGAPYIKHPIEVARTLANLRMDTTVIVAGLLHGVVEDTKHSTEEIREKFGTEVAEMVDSVTKISDIQKGIDRTAKTFKKFLAYVSKRPQIIAIKLADRLDNMHSLQYLAPERQKAISEETLDFYAPLAHRLGLYSFKFALEDLAFKYLHPEEYVAIESHLELTSKEREEYIASIIFPLNIKMNLEQLDCDIRGRSKHIYSIHEKMAARGCKIDELYDIFAIRIIVNQIADCYIALGYVHNLWMPLYSRFKDYIAVPKPNLYQSLHTTVIGPYGKLVEVQIRTKDMNETAEYGMAAHWAYKFNLKKEELEKNMDWVNAITKMQNEIPNSTEFLGFLHESLLPEDSFAWTPQGKKISLPLGSTILDFAFAVHTDLGIRCLGARVAGKVLSIDAAIPIGETIQILQSDSQEPQETWLSMAKTPKAQNSIRHWLRKAVTIQSEILGKKIWQKELRYLKISKENFPGDYDICKAFNAQNMSSFYESLGKGEIPLKDIFIFLKQYSDHSQGWSKLKLFNVFSSSDEDTPISIGHNERFLLNYASCCNPVPGVLIKGILKSGKGIEIHKEDCKILNKVPQEQRLSLLWEAPENSERERKCILRIEANDRLAIERDIFNAIAKNNALVKKTTFQSKGDRIRGRVDLLVFNSAQVKNIEQSLQAIVGIRKVTVL
ncbi:MAG: RelA/SpoT family protein [Fibromonadaceae bacterium]|jgi:GTP pyrophosphokinase|nr:RelA/SpoT family protein [Fibromonadaceae bacterium]